MHRHSRLEVLEATVAKRLHRLSRRAADLRAGRSHLIPWRTESETSAIAIYLHNTWTNACRWYLVSCISGARSKSGVEISCPTGITRVDDALMLAIRSYNPKVQFGPKGSWRPRDEPPWNSPPTLLVIAKRSGLTNEQDLVTALSAGYRVFDDLPRFRNYFAHRNQDTRANAIALAPRYGVGVTSKPSDVLLAIHPTAAESVIENWSAETTLTLEAICA
jgi:hypothetical protein